MDPGGSLADSTLLYSSTQRTLLYTHSPLPNWYSLRYTYPIEPPQLSDRKPVEPLLIT